MSATVTTGTPDFADVYAQHLPSVWRFVRARIGDHHEAHDVTSDVFVRAWRSWDRFDPRRPVEPWLFTIAHRTVADWLRRRRPEAVAELEIIDPRPDPQEEVLRGELLGQLAQALEGLSPRERDGLALRFAARLTSAHIAEVLGTTPAAAKMLVHRAINGLRAAALTEQPASGDPADLEAVIDEVLARGHATMTDADLRGMLVALAAAHDHEVPDELPSHVAFCVRCASEDDLDRPAATSGAARAEHRGGRVANTLSSLIAFAGLCLVCTIPALQTLVFALGIGAAAYVAHLAAVAGAPLAAYLVYRGFRRHGRSRGFQLARAGAVVMMVHLTFHVAWELNGGLTPRTTTAFGLTDWVASGLLIGGALLNLVDTRAWRQREYLRFASA